MSTMTSTLLGRGIRRGLLGGQRRWQGILLVVLVARVVRIFGARRPVAQRIDLEALSQTASVDLSALEAGFATHAAAYGGRRGISYAAWREIGVSSPTLKSAGIRRSA